MGLAQEVGSEGVWELACIGFGKGRHGASCEEDKVSTSLRQRHTDYKQSVMSEIGV